MIRRLLTILIFAAFSAIAYLSTYGWQFTKASVSVYSIENKQMTNALKKHVFMLSEEIGWRSSDHYNNLIKSANYIALHFKKLGLEVELQEFSAKGKKFYNIIAQRKGSKYPNQHILIGAHYDSYFNPGADNDASGIAALLELAGAVSNQRPASTVRFVAFSNAEAPFFGTEEMGSVVYVRRAKEQKEDIAAVFILDSIGYYSKEPYSQRYPPFVGFFYPDKAHFIALAGNFHSSHLLKNTENIFKQTVSLPCKSVIAFDFINSDHWIFWKEHYQAVLITDTGSYRNPYYFSLFDTYKKLDYRNMAQIVEALSSILRHLEL